MNIRKLSQLIISLILFLPLFAGCSPAQTTVTPQEKTVNPTSPADSVSQATQNTTQPTTVQITTTQPTVTPPAVTVPTISTQDAFVLIQKNPGLIIIDVRTADEFNSEHIANAINMDYYSPDFKSIVDKLDKNKQYLIYCRSGVRGTGATKIMLDIGFKDIYNLTGGIIRWIQDGSPTVK